MVVGNRTTGTASVVPDCSSTSTWTRRPTGCASTSASPRSGVPVDTGPGSRSETAWPSLPTQMLSTGAQRRRATRCDATRSWSRWTTWTRITSGPGSGAIVSPPTDHSYGERQYSAQDLEGHHWTFTQAIADLAPEDWGGTSAPLTDETGERPSRQCHEAAPAVCRDRLALEVLVHFLVLPATSHLLPATDTPTSERRYRR